MEIGVGGDCVKTSVAMGDILIEMVYNRIIEAKGRTETLNGIVTPLAELAERTDTLTASMKVAEAATQSEDLLKQAEEIRTEQHAVLEVMRSVLERMIKVAEAQELAYKLERLIERWEGVMRDTGTRADWDIQNAIGFNCSECTKPLGPDGGPGVKVKCPNCNKTVAKPTLKGSDSD
jgi:FtsZ-binding cell division protein ZapB